MNNLFLSTIFGIFCFGSLTLSAAPQSKFSQLTALIFKTYAARGSDEALRSVGNFIEKRGMGGEITEAFLQAQPVGSELRTAIVIGRTLKAGSVTLKSTGEAIAVGGWNESKGSMTVYQIFHISEYTKLKPTDIDFHITEVNSRIQWLIKDQNLPLVLVNARAGAARPLMKTVDGNFHKAVVAYRIDGIDKIDVAAFERFIDGLSKMEVNY